MTRVAQEMGALRLKNRRLAVGLLGIAAALLLGSILYVALGS